MLQIVSAQLEGQVSLEDQEIVEGEVEFFVVRYLSHVTGDTYTHTYNSVKDADNKGYV